MFTKNIIILSLTAFAIADPVPRPAPQATTDSLSASFPTSDLALSSELASLSSLEAVYSGMPSLPASVQSYLLTAVPTSEASLTDGCDYAATTPGWLATAPAYVKSALTSYDSAIVSWYSAHSTAFAGDTSSYTATYSTYLPTGTCGGGVASTGSAKTSGKASTKTTGTAPTASATVSKAGNSSSTATGTGTAASSTGSSAAAPRNGAVVLSFAGMFGVLGFIAAL
ncbi:hypothetical protein EG329_005228 [Mollisiaceae sp. DMI_Dod_QoI]|nr:hypothetical protein EG329_005228 [Helotiales sp. DMI_Dod_QoI]